MTCLVTLTNDVVQVNAEFNYHLKALLCSVYEGSEMFFQLNDRKKSRLEIEQSWVRSTHCHGNNFSENYS